MGYVERARPIPCKPLMCTLPTGDGAGARVPALSSSQPPTSAPPTCTLVHSRAKTRAGTFWRLADRRWTSARQRSFARASWPPSGSKQLRR